MLIWNFHSQGKTKFPNFLWSWPSTAKIIHVGSHFMVTLTTIWHNEEQLGKVIWRRPHQIGGGGNYDFHQNNVRVPRVSIQSMIDLGAFSRWTESLHEDTWQTDWHLKIDRSLGSSSTTDITSCTYIWLGLSIIKHHTLSSTKLHSSSSPPVASKDQRDWQRMFSISHIGVNNLPKVTVNSAWIEDEWLISRSKHDTLLTVSKAKQPLESKNDSNCTNFQVWVGPSPSSSTTERNHFLPFAITMQHTS